MTPATYYLASARPAPTFAPLEGPREAEVVIVGGGYAGLCTALGLAERGVRDIVLLEAERVGHGASGRNGGFVFAGYSLGEAALLRTLGPERARRVYRASVDAVGLIRERVRRHAIACDLVDEGVLWANWFRDDGILRARQRLLAEHFGERWDYVDRRMLGALLGTSRYSGALRESNAMHLHPLDYARGLARAASGLGVSVHEASRARSLHRDGMAWRVDTASGALRARHLVLACGGYLAGLRGDIDASVLPIATYVMATEPLGARLREVFKATRAAVYDTRFAFDYYRPLPDTRLLWGGRISIRDRDAAAVAKLLRRDLLRVYPQLDGVRIDFAWSGLMSYARHEMPQVRELEPGLWCAQAFGGHGLATTTVAGEVLAAAITGDRALLEDLSAFDLPKAHKPFGFLAAQASYWWLQAQDAWRARRERRSQKDA